jgi:hypothetical protein
MFIWTRISRSGSFFVRRSIYYIISLSLIGCHSRISFPPGGYPYPGQVTDKDSNSYAYPIKDKESRKDSFYDAYSYVYFRPFNEPNLSLRPQAEPLFRLTYGAIARPPVIICLRPEEITVKVGNSPEILGPPDTNKLSPLENLHLRILQSDFPIDEIRKSSSNVNRRRWIDSLGRLYPQLYDPAYYKYLLEKERVPPSKPFTYTFRKIEIPPSKYDSLVNLINASGYWKLPYKIDCDDPPTDGDAFVLEANTASRYNHVWVLECDVDTSKLEKACQELVKAARMDKEIKLAWDGIPDSNQVWHPPIVVQDVQLEEVREPVQHKHKKSSQP